MSAEEKPTPEDVSVRWVRSENGVYSGYSDYLYMNWTSLVIRIRFGQIVPDPQDPPEKSRFAIEEHSTITMPWYQAKVLRDLLINSIQRYEKVNGEIKLPVLPD